MSVILPILQGMNGTASDTSSGRSGNSLDGGQGSQSGGVSVGTQVDSSAQTVAPRSNVGLTDASSSTSSSTSTENSAASSGIAAETATTAETANSSKVGVPWPSPLMPVPFWMLVSNGHGWGWAFAANKVADGTAGSNISGGSASSSLATYL